MTSVNWIMMCKKMTILNFSNHKKKSLPTYLWQLNTFSLKTLPLHQLLYKNALTQDGHVGFRPLMMNPVYLHHHQQKYAVKLSWWWQLAYTLWDFNKFDFCPTFAPSWDSEWSILIGLLYEPFIPRCSKWNSFETKWVVVCCFELQLLVEMIV